MAFVRDDANRAAIDKDRDIVVGPVNRYTGTTTTFPMLYRNGDVQFQFNIASRSEQRDSVGKSGQRYTRWLPVETYIIERGLRNVIRRAYQQAGRGALSDQGYDDLKEILREAISVRSVPPVPVTFIDTPSDVGLVDNPRHGGVGGDHDDGGKQ